MSVHADWQREMRRPGWAIDEIWNGDLGAVVGRVRLFRLPRGRLLLSDFDLHENEGDSEGQRLETGCCYSYFSVLCYAMLCCTMHLHKLHPPSRPAVGCGSMSTILIVRSLRAPQQYIHTVSVYIDGCSTLLLALGSTLFLALPVKRWISGRQEGLLFVIIKCIILVQNNCC